jgi:hypothetical protein
MKTWSQEFREKALHLFKVNFGSNYGQYRFNKKSNFISYEQFMNDEAIERIISLGKELERIKEFKDLSNEGLKAAVDKWHQESHDIVSKASLEILNAFYHKERGINASYELKRRQDEEYFNSLKDSSEIA